MYCPNCGKEINLIEKYYGVEYGICEYCRHEFSMKDHGQVSPERMADAQRAFQEQYEKEVKGTEPIKTTLDRMGYMVMHNPEERERPGRIVARYKYRGR